MSTPRNIDEAEAREQLVRRLERALAIRQPIERRLFMHLRLGSGGHHYVYDYDIPHLQSGVRKAWDKNKKEMVTSSWWNSPLVLGTYPNLRALVAALKNPPKET